MQDIMAAGNYNPSEYTDLMYDNPAYFNFDKDLLGIANIEVLWTNVDNLGAELYEKVRYVYAPIGGLSVQLTHALHLDADEETAMEWLSWDLSARLTKFVNLKHLFVLIGGLTADSPRRGRVNEEVDETLKQLKARHRAKDWNIPAYMIVEDERELLRVWESWKVE
jgi:hypothetical protein